MIQIMQNWNYLNYCGVSPLLDSARLATSKFDERHSIEGTLVFGEYPDALGELRQSAAALLKTDKANLSFVRNTAEGMSLIANGYPFQSGDEIVSYIHEYPSNHYPWVLQNQRGVKLNLIQDRLTNLSEDMAQFELNSLPGPTAFSIEDIDSVVTKNTRIIAISHVQFTSGFAVNLKELGEYCKDRNIDLVVDAAQSLGSLPLYPDQFNISAIAASGWKWLRGPLGTGLLFTSEEFRSKLNQTMAGADLMKQGQDYLNHNWDPYADGRRFEYSTAPLSLAVALKTCIDELPLKNTVEGVQSYIRGLQDQFIQELKEYSNTKKYSAQIKPVIFDNGHRSCILSIIVPNPEQIMKQLKDKRIICTARGGYLRFAPHL
ncbi:MAG: aminotransferase class V-fold PLP-dependent enzyme, partial [Leptonema sp. (in: Bacteria)]|nr:aminotransferase class V-fold PLP-dependent enzyme [Leptonema sp. (in: bacteria)]